MSRAWPGGTDWGDAADVARELSNCLAAWASYLELLGGEPDRRHADDDRQSAAEACDRFRAGAGMAARAGGLWPRHAEILVACGTPQEASALLQPYINAHLRRRKVDESMGPRLALAHVARAHAAALLEALKRADEQAIETAIGAAWADRLLSLNEADILAGSDRAAAERRAMALGAAWPR